MSATIDDKKLDGAGLATLWGIIKQYIVDNPSIPKATASTLGCIMVGTTLGVNNSGVLNLASGVVTAGTYKSVTVDTYGRVTAGANPNTLAGYGITDAKISNGSIILGENSITPITSLSGYATQTWVQQQGYLTEETYKGTVTQVKVGTTAYDPTSGVVSLPSYPTTLPASDVYSWAKAASKPSYTASEVGAATSGHTHTTSLASDSGTSTITLASAGKYKLTAGGTSVIFTMPTIPTVSYPVTSVNSKTGAVTLTASDVGAATSGHTHTTSIATSSGTNQLTLAFGTKYVLTAGGTSYIFTMPSNPNTNTTYKFTIGSTTNGDATNGVDLGTLKSETAAASGTTLSLVTTGEKATWNAKSNLTIGTTATTAAAGNHTHTLSIATSSGTNALTLAANTKYVLTAGGSTFIFTTPTDTNTWRPLGTGASDACAGNDSRLSDSRPASDVYSWAKASSKPTYTASEVGAATSSHTHTTSIATSTGTNQITLAHGGKYAITAGGTSYIFTMPSDNNTTYSAGTGLSLSGTTFSLATSGVTAGTYKRVTVDAYGRVTSGDNTDANDNTWRNIYTGGTSRVGTGTDTKAINFVAGSNVSISYEAAGTGSGQSGNANYFNVKIAATDTTYSAATQSAAGLMSAADKTKLDGIASGANAYSLPAASTSALGGIKVNYTNSGKNYKVQLDSSNNAYVNVPWTDNNTTYSVFTDAAAGLAPAASSTNKTTAESAVGNYYLCADGKYRQLPANAFLNSTYTVSNGTYSIKALVGSTTTTLSDFTANQSSADDFTLVQGSNITFTVDATNRKLTIAGTANSTYPKAVKNITRSGTTFTATCYDDTTFTFDQQDNNTTYSAATQSAAGLMSAADKKKLDGIATSANNYSLPTASADTLGGIKVGTTLSISSGVLNLATSGVTAGTYKRVTVDSYGRVTSGDNTDANDNTWRGIYVKGTSSIGTGTNTKALNFAAGSNVSISFAAAGTGSGQSGNANYGTITINATDTTYSAATQSAAGLMSAADKKKLDGIASGANAYSLPAASTSALGGIKVNYTNSGKNYKVQLDSSNNAYVNVPWENTTYTIPTKVSQLTNDSGYITSYTNTWRNVYLAGTEKVGTGTGTKGLNFVAGSNVSITYEAAGTSSGQSGNANYFNIKIAATDTTYSAATQSANGLMSAADKKKLDGIASGANAYSLPTASSSALGGIKVGASVSGKNYAVKLDSSNCAYVNVPWTDNNTTYTQASLGQVYAYSTPPTSGTAVTATNSDYVLATGGILAVQFDTNPVPASATLNVNSKGAKNIKYKKAALAAGVIKAGDLATFMYDGTQYELLTVDRTMKAVTDISRNGTTFTATCVDGSTFTFTQQDNNTTYTLAGLMGSSAKGSTTQPIYWNGSAFANTTYTLGKSVPSDAKFTDTTYTFTNKSATLAWSTTSTIATVGGVDIKVTMPANPNTDHYAWTDITGKPNIFLSNSLYVADNYINGTKYTALNNGVYTHTKTQDSETLLHFQNTGASASGLDILFTYGQSSSAPLKYRKNIDNERFAATTWVDIIDSLNISSQSVSYATSAGRVGDGTNYLYCKNNEVNFGGTYSIDTIEFGSTACDSKPIPTAYKFGGSSATAAVYCNNIYTPNISSIVLGTGTYTTMRWGLYTNHYEFEFPKTTDSANGTNIPVYMGWRGGTYALTLAANTNVGISTTSPSYKLHVNGACAATSFPNISDIRKKNIVKDNLSIGLNAIANAPLFDFTWKDVSLDKDLHIGSSAQYWKNVIPEAVTMAQDEMCTLSMQYDVIAFASIVSVAKETITLKEKVALLETRVESLEKKIREYESN